MLLMAILPIMLICTILAATVLDRRGYLGNSLRLVGVVSPLAAIAASVALGIAAAYFMGADEVLAQDRVLGIYALAAAMFHLMWALLFVVARTAWAAVIGALGTGLTTVGSALLGILHLPAYAGSAVYLGTFQMTLILLLVPSIAPSLASALAQREMPVQRAVVLGAFGVATVALFTSSALVGAG
jgi:hypothetical protein